MQSPRLASRAPCIEDLSRFIQALYSNAFEGIVDYDSGNDLEGEPRHDGFALRIGYIHDVQKYSLLLRDLVPYVPRLLADRARSGYEQFQFHRCMGLSGIMLHGLRPILGRQAQGRLDLDQTDFPLYSPPMDLNVLDIQPLKDGYLLGPLTPTELDEVLAHATVRTLAPGERLFAQGDPCTHFFFVLSGIMKLCRMAPTGEEKVIELIRHGQYFAEAVMFMGGQYPVHAYALEAARLVALDSQHFLGLVRSNADLSLRLLSTMSRRMHGMINEIDNLTLHSGAQRVIGYLLDQLPEGVAASPSVRLLVPKHVIASRLGIQPETLSRVLAKLRGDHLIDVHDDTIVLNDVDALRRLA